MTAIYDIVDTDIIILYIFLGEVNILAASTTKLILKYPFAITLVYKEVDAPFERNS